MAPKTTVRRITSIRAFARWADWGSVLDKYKAPVPAKGVAHPLPEGIEGVYRLIEFAHTEHHKALIALCGLCGCRVAEALAVRPSDFDLNEMELKIRGKGDRERVVPVSTNAWEFLRPAVMRAFCTGADEQVVPMKNRYARRVITDIGRRAALKRHISSHDLRSTFGTETFNNTLNLRVVQELLGHSHSTTTELYTGVTKKKMHDAVETL